MHKGGRSWRIVPLDRKVLTCCCTFAAQRIVPSEHHAGCEDARLWTKEPLWKGARHTGAVVEITNGWPRHHAAAKRVHGTMHGLFIERVGRKVVCRADRLADRQGKQGNN